MKKVAYIVIAFYAASLLLFAQEEVSPEKAKPLSVNSSDAIALEHAPSLSVFSVNVHYPLKKDPEKIAWENRKDMLFDMLRFYDVDFACFQEMSKPQMRDLLAMGEFDTFSMPPTPSLVRYQGNAIAWRKSRLEALDKGAFWLCEDPSKPGISWGAMKPRNVVWIKFKDLSTNREFFVFNTTLDQKSEEARLEGVKLILSQAAKIAQNAPAILSVDATGINPSDVSKELSASLKDSKSISENGHYGPNYSFHNFTGTRQISNPETSTFIFVSPNVKVSSHASLSDNRNAAYPSDYFPILTKIEMN